MNLISICRNEFTIELILISMMIYIFSRYKRGQSKKNNYLLLILTAFGHNTFGIITEITVNNPKTPLWVNDTFHRIFFIFALLFMQEYFRYLLSLILSSREVKRYSKTAYFVTLVGVGSLFISKIEYFEGTYSNYSGSLGVDVCFGFALVLFVSATLIFIANMKKVDKLTKVMVIATTIMAVCIVSAQFILKEVFFTETAMVVVLFNLLISSEDPMNIMEKQAYVDYTTGLYNRNSYEADIRKNKYRNPSFVMCDLNDLKYYNDNYGHLEGDKRIRMAADVLQEAMSSATKIYRIGGDEYLCLYEAGKADKLNLDIKKAKLLCEEKSIDMEMPLYIAMGYAIHKDGDNIEDVINRADEAMYRDKKMAKGQEAV